MNLQDFIICRCEEVSYQDLVNVVANFKCSSRETKLRTRAGMGYCGGRTCRHLINEIVANETDEKPFNQIPLKYQPPIRPISFGQLGGIK